MVKVVSSMGELVDFDALKIQQSLEDASIAVTAPAYTGRVSHVSAEQLGMGSKKPPTSDGLVSLETDSTKTRKITR